MTSSVKVRSTANRSRKIVVDQKRKEAPEKTFHHSVYVILLDPAVLQHSSILRLNPNRDPAKPCVYVGMTGLAVQDRFQNHKEGQKSAWVVKKYGLRLIPELYEYLNPMPFEAAAQMEKDLAEDLRADGYTVAGGT
jgi:predicted GIY-YIG superfamily endonuclease